MPWQFPFMIIHKPHVFRNVCDSNVLNVVLIFFNGIQTSVAFVPRRLKEYSNAILWSHTMSPCLIQECYRTCSRNYAHGLPFDIHIFQCCFTGIVQVNLLWWTWVYKSYEWLCTDHSHSVLISVNWFSWEPLRSLIRDANLFCGGR